MEAFNDIKVKIVKEEGNEGLYEVGPLPKGYGHTLGNALRRILYSSLEGSGITSVKIKGIKHEYSTIKGVKEDKKKDEAQEEENKKAKKEKLLPVI